MDVTKVECPVLERWIEDIDCIENRDVVDGNLIERFLPDDFKNKSEWKGICITCKWHDY